MAEDTREYAWALEAGQTEALDVPITLGGDPVDLRDWTVDVKIRPVQGAGPALGTFTPAAEAAPDAATWTLIHLAHADPAARDGVRLAVPAPRSLAWAKTWTTGWWRLVVADPDGTAQRVVQGPFVISPD